MHKFCYASESTSEKQHLLEDLTAILSEARNFNYKHQISGVLYFAQGYFFSISGRRFIDAQYTFGKTSFRFKTSQY